MSEPGVSAVREEAYRAAAAAVDRFLGRIDESTADQLEDVGDAARGRFLAELGRMVDLNLDMVRKAFGTYGSLFPSEIPSGRDDVLDLGSATPGASATTVLWVHNFEQEAMSGVALAGSPLVSKDSKFLEKPHWSFSPAAVTVPPQSALPVIVGLEIPADAIAGSYVGTITVRDREALPIEARLEVVSGEPISHESW